MERALSLPEIRNLVLSHFRFEPRWIHACRLVNREWNLSLDPIFWLRVTIDPRKRSSPPSTLAQKAHHTRYLFFGGPFHSHLPSLPCFSNLEIMHFQTGRLSEHLNDSEWANLSAFLNESCSTVQKLFTAHTGWTEKSYGEMTDLFTALGQVRWKDLQVLHVTAAQVPRETMVAFWRMVCSSGVKDLRLEGFHCIESVVLDFWKQLETAQLARDEQQQQQQGDDLQGLQLDDGLGESLLEGDEPASLREEDPQEERLDNGQQVVSDHDSTGDTQRPQQEPVQEVEVVWSQVRELTMEDIPSNGVFEIEIISMMILAPELEAVRWSEVYSFPQASFLSTVKSGYWTGLRSIRGDLDSQEDEQLASMIQGMAYVEELTLYGAKFGPLAFKALCDHPEGLSRIRILDLHRNKFVTSGMTQRILEESPQLTNIRITTPLSVLDAVKGQPWACRSSLKELNMCFVLPVSMSGSFGEDSLSNEETLRLNHGMIELLSTLTNLKSFNNTSGGNCAVSGQRRVAFDLKGGLDQLKAWTRMESILFQGESAPMALEDLDWMLDHWTEVRSLQLRLPEGVDLTPEQVAKADARSTYLYRHMD